MPRPKPLPLTDEQIDWIGTRGALLTIEQIADRLGISSSSLRRRMHSDPRVVTAYKKAKAVRINMAISALMKLVRDGNPTAIIFLLKTQAGWRESDPGKLAPGEIAKLPDAELQKRRKKLGLVG